mmetsp:Transcript_73161/g.206047  ORF Transcript_73161/g.206047 Transcript_73161/m.206047 type:complete len:240 (-) Transcript_73161:1075-1794(-)
MGVLTMSCSPSGIGGNEPFFCTACASGFFLARLALPCFGDFPQPSAPALPEFPESPDLSVNSQGAEDDEEAAAELLLLPLDPLPDSLKGSLRSRALSSNKSEEDRPQVFRWEALISLFCSPRPVFTLPAELPVAEFFELDPQLESVPPAAALLLLLDAPHVSRFACRAGRGDDDEDELERGLSGAAPVQARKSLSARRLVPSSAVQSEYSASDHSEDFAASDSKFAESNSSQSPLVRAR